MRIFITLERMIETDTTSHDQVWAVLKGARIDEVFAEEQLSLRKEVFGSEIEP